MPDLPEDRPTEPLRPRPPVAAEAAVARDVVDAGWAAHIEDQLRSLKSMMVMLGVLAVAALGLALYGLLRDDDDGGDARGAGQERVAQLDQRVDRLETTSEKSDVDGLGERVEDKADKSEVEQLGADVEELRAAVEAGGTDDTVAQDLADLRQQVEALAADVEELQRESEQSP